MFRKNLYSLFAAATALTVCLSSAAFAQVSIVVNNVGYERTGTKRAIVQSSSAIAATSFEVVNASGTVVHTGALGAQSASAQWSGAGFGNFKVADFSAFTTDGEGYRVRVGTAASPEFAIGQKILQAKTGADQVTYFYLMRHGYHSNNAAAHPNGGVFESTGGGEMPADRAAYEALDSNIPIHGRGTEASPVRRNLRGGWWDASGDAGKHLSHLAFSNYYTPQQIPMVAWALLHAHEAQPSAFGNAARAEAAWGADYLLRALDPDSAFFYMSIFDNWGMGADHSRHIPTAGQRAWREICAWGSLGNSNIEEMTDGTFNSRGFRSPHYHSAFREGAGVSIAALARAAQMGISGDSSSAQYLAGAVRAYDHLVRDGNYKVYPDDKVPNIIDFYTGLLAATELYKATDEAYYLTEARRWVDSLVSLQHSDGWFYSGNDAKGRARPFYHAAEEGFPVVALSRFYLVAASNAEKLTLREVIGKNLAWYNTITYNGVYGANPFEYARMWRRKPTGQETDIGGPYTVTVQAENFSERTGDFRITEEANRTVIGFIEDGHSATYTVNADHADSYALAFMLASAQDIRFTVTVNTSSPVTMSISGGTNGWDNFRIETLGSKVQLRQGSNTIRLNFESAVNIDFFRAVSDNHIIEAPPLSDNGAYFFIPKVNETGYWWQGENARLASMASAFILGAPMADHTGVMWDTTLFKMATSQLDWILGRNPFDLTMMYGYGTRNFPPLSTARHLSNIKGAICNGISSARSNEQNIEWAPYDGFETWMNWRFVEQWLPHNAWYLIAVSSLSYRIDNPIEPENISVRHISRARPSRMKVSVGHGRIVRITLPSAAGHGTSIALYNMRGRRIFTHNIEEGNRAMTIKIPANIARGMYVLSVKDLSGKNRLSDKIKLK